MLKIALMGLLLVTQCAIDGVSIMLLWNWFMPPIGVKPIGFLLAIGIGLIGALLTHQYVPKQSDIENGVDVLKHCYLRPVILVGIGLVVKGLM